MAHEQHHEMTGKPDRITAHRVMYITESSGYGGAEKYLLYLVADQLQRAEVSVALPFRKCNFKFRTMLKDLGVTLIDLPQFMAIYPVNLLIALLFFLRKNSPIFHFSLPYPDSCRWALTAAALLRKRFLITEHLVPPDPFKAGVYFAVTHLLFNRLKRISYDRASKVIAVSNGNKEILVHNYGMPANKMVVIHNGIDCGKYAPETGTDEVTRREFGVAPEEMVLSCIGRLADQKGQKFLLEALEVLAVEGYRPVLLLVGEGPMEEQLQREVKEKGLAPQVRFLGFRNDIEKVLAATDIFVMPSLNEGFPLTLLEAMASAKPIVTTRVTGTSEAIVDGENGLLCAPGSSQELANSIRALLKDPVRRRALGEQARRTALAQFDVSIMVSKTVCHYSKEGDGCAGQ